MVVRRGSTSQWSTDNVDGQSQKIKYVRRTAHWRNHRGDGGTRPTRFLKGRLWSHPTLGDAGVAVHAVGSLLQCISCLRRLKTYLRSTVRQERLNHTAILTVHHELLHGHH